MSCSYYIACATCKRFLNLNRWRIFPSVQFPVASKAIFKGAGNVALVSISPIQLQEQLKNLDDPFSINYKETQDFQALVGILKKFNDEHANHELFFINSSGDYPWVACDRYPWYEWKEIIGPNSDLKNTDLPKNLMDDLHLNSWEQIEKHLLLSPRYNPLIFPEDIELVKTAFKKLSA